MTNHAPTALAVREQDHAALAMVMEPSEAEERLRQLQDFVRRTMVEGQDYGKIPGTDKNTLLQPGAQKLAEIYGFAVRFEDERAPIERWEDDASFFAYFKRAVISRRCDGLFLGSGVGSCNSKEEKYAGRWVFEREVPAHLDLSRLRVKHGTSKKNGKPFTLYRVPNPAIYDLVNTIEKMACKRALVHAVIGVTRSAGIFTQDLEDISRTARGENDDVPDAEFTEEAPPPPARPAPPPQKTPADALAAIKAATDSATIGALLADIPRDWQKVRANGWGRLIAFAPDVAALDTVVDVMREDITDEAIRGKLMSDANARAKAVGGQSEADGAAQPAGAP
jgi:hypothetical protein